MTNSDLFNIGVTVTKMETLPIKEISNLFGVSEQTIIRWKKDAIPPMATIILMAVRDKKITLDDIRQWRGFQTARAPQQSQRMFGQDGYDQEGYDREDFDRDGVKRGHIINRK